MNDSEWKPHELTPVYLLGRINLLDNAIELFAQVSGRYMPPEGQQALADIGTLLDKSNAEWAAQCEGRLEEST